MREYGYEDFDLLVDRRGDAYTVRVLDSPAGTTPAVPVELPFTEQDLRIFLLSVGRPGRAVRDARSPEAGTARDFGARLFDAVFGGSIGQRLVASQQAAEARGLGLRVRLRLADVPELADLPWEFLYDQERRRFLALSEWSPLVRFLELPDPPRALEVSRPLRVLGVVASPTDYGELEVEREWSKIEASLAHLVADGRVVLERVEPPTLRTLVRQLRRADWHVLHFIGHGQFDDRDAEGQLVLETDTGRGARVRASDFGALLHDHRSLRLCVLNACEGARSGVADPFAGTAQCLLLQGVPAVVAMQFEISDAAAVVFAEELYAAVADGLPLDAAVAEGRAALLAEGNAVEWGTPVLYMSTPDGRIFDVRDAGPHERRPAVSDAGSVVAAAAPAGSLEQRVLSALRPLGVHDKVHLAPDIPPAKERNARAVLRAPDAEPLLGLVDCTIFGSAKDCIAFTTGGVYSRMQSDAVLFVPYDQLATLTLTPADTFLNPGVDIGDGRRIKSTASNVPVADLAAAMRDVARAAGG